MGPGDTVQMQEKKKKNIMGQLQSLHKWVYKANPMETLPSLNESIDTTSITKPLKVLNDTKHTAKFFESRRGKSQLATTQPNSPRKVSIDLHLTEQRAYRETATGFYNVPASTKNDYEYEIGETTLKLQN